MFCAIQQCEEITFLLIVNTFLGQGNGALSLFRNGVSSLSYSSGIVRIYYNSVWGNICHDSHTGSTEANVICHQLGYTGASRYSRASDERYIN